MKKNFLQKLLSAALVALSTAAFAGNVNVIAPITTSTTWTNNNTYILFGDILVKNGATLTIEPGTLIKGDKTTLSRIVVTTGSKINAQGTPTQPIVFTSNQPVGQRSRADWAGIVVCGLAPVNFKDANNNPIQGVAECGTAGDYSFGGNNANDSSGVISYVRIEYAGYVCGTNTELNSLTLCGVGAKTKIDHVMVSYGQDDGVELFGGTANVSHFISLGSRDDDFDTDNGWSGKAQYGLIIRVDTIADQGDISNAFESDNDANGSSNSPYTASSISNFTVIGPAATTTSPIDPKYGWCARIRRNSSESIFNSVFIGYKRGLRIEGDSSRANATAGGLNFKNNIIAGCVEAYGEAAFDSAYLNNVANGNTIYGGNANDSVKLVAPYSAYDFGNFVPQAGSPALTGADFSNSKLSSFETTTYRGAFGTTDWTACWAEFSPQDENYTSGPINYGFAVNISQTGSLPSATLTTSATGTYNWSTGATTQSITVTNAGTYTVTVTGARGCQVEGTVSVVTGINDVKNNINSLSLFPNPTANNATLQTSLSEAAEVNVIISDVTGRTMFSQTQQMGVGVNWTIINTADYANGIYLVRIQNGTENQTIRLIVNK